MFSVLFILGFIGYGLIMQERLIICLIILFVIFVLIPAFLMEFLKEESKRIDNNNE